MTTLPERPVCVVIGALGGEGGGVLANWMVRAAELCNFPTQSTSIPGVAQRTGATTYYIEIFAAPNDALNGREPVMALYPAPGNMDIVVASELMEAGRMLENGMVTPDNTTLIASTHRIYSIYEKSAMGDGLFNTEKLNNAARKLAKRSILFDMAKLAEENDTVLNAIVLGVIAGSGEMPIPTGIFAQSIKDAGVAVEANLRGFEIGLAYMRGDLTAPASEPVTVPLPVRPNTEDLLAVVATDWPAETQMIVSEGVKRLVDYQNPAYARLYLERLAGIRECDRAAGGEIMQWTLTAETARYLALMMSYEDIIRVADLKSRRSRFRRVRAEVMAKPGEPVRMTEFLKPGFDEFTSIMPPWLGHPIMNWAETNAWARSYNMAMRVRTDTIFGFLRLWFLARLRFYRPRTFRYTQEQAMIGAWLDTVQQAAARDYSLAVEIAELANLRKGYSDTRKRGIGNYTRLMEEIAIPCARADKDPVWGAMALARARDAALADPDGTTLDHVIADISSSPITAAQ